MASDSDQCWSTDPVMVGDPPKSSATGGRLTELTEVTNSVLTVDSTVCSVLTDKLTVGSVLRDGLTMRSELTYELTVGSVMIDELTMRSVLLAVESMIMGCVPLTVDSIMGSVLIDETTIGSVLRVDNWTGSLDRRLATF